MSDDNWPLEKIDLLRSLWARGDSGSEIGRIMGISKNAVVGKAHRLRLPPRPSPIKVGQRQYSVRRQGGDLARRAAAGVVIPPAPAATSLGASGAPRPGAAAFSARRDVSSLSNFPVLAARLTNPAPARGFLERGGQPMPQLFPVRGCQFPMWPNGVRVALEDMRFCDSPARRNAEGRQDSAYCPAHQALCFQKAREAA
ncbi:MAG: GcrA family cell cycle regulator [bacterium]